MKQLTILILLLLCGYSGKTQIPDLELKSLENKLVSIEDLQGEKLTVIDFWATWCKPCVAAIPKLNEIHNQFSEKGVSFIGINVDGPRNQAKVKPFVKSLNISYPILLDTDQELVNDFNVGAFPTLIVLNEKGKEVFVHEGFNNGDEKLISTKLENLLKR